VTLPIWAVVAIFLAVFGVWTLAVQHIESNMGTGASALLTSLGLFLPILAFGIWMGHLL
jgi:hypothetical protein